MKTKTTFLILFLFSAVLLSSCRSSRGTRQQRQAYQMEDQMKEDSEKASAEYRQHQYDIQAEKTQEMMKKSKKRNKQLKDRNREPFFKRIFGKKRSKGCNGN
ncbi:MAG: hypothetical protein ABFS05_01130 [Bacteroidota bacterium]